MPQEYKEVINEDNCLSAAYISLSATHEEVKNPNRKWWQFWKQRNVWVEKK